MNNANVFIQNLKIKFYPKEPPFNPSRAYPEYLFKEISSEENQVYEGIRNLLYLMGFDKENFNTKFWNPFKDIISPGNIVLIKPNLVIDRIYFQDAVTTHVSLIRAIIDYVLIALKGNGEIIVGDAPLQSCDFDNLCKINGLKETINYYNLKNIKISLSDFRLERLIKKNRINTKILKIKGDRKGYSVINLKSESNLHKFSQDNGFKKFRVWNYDPQLMHKAHNQVDHKYLISNSVLHADVVINLPKIKTHKKAGITACLKNIIGINGHKDWLPHHKTGSILEGGDEYLNRDILKKIIVKLNEFDDILLIKNYYFHKIIQYPRYFLKLLIYGFMKIFERDSFFGGSWYGNKTLWRVICDLNQILIFANKEGEITSKPQRKIINFCDGVISGESEGPLKPLPKRTGILIGGFDPLMIDLAITELINFDYKKIPQIHNIFNLKYKKISNLKPKDLKIVSNNNNWNNKSLNQLLNVYNFKPSKGWKNHIEKNN